VGSIPQRLGGVRQIPEVPDREGDGPSGHTNLSRTDGQRSEREGLSRFLENS